MYILQTTSNTEEYILLEGGFSAELRKASQNSQIQHVDKSEITMHVSNKRGRSIPDITYQDSIILISSRFKSILDRIGIDYVFYKKVYIVGENFGIDEVFYILIPPMVNCIDLNSLPDDAAEELKNWDASRSITPMIDVDDFEILESALGRFEMFKVFGILDDDIYITDSLYEKLKKENLDGIYFYEV